MSAAPHRPSSSFAFAIPSRHTPFIFVVSNPDLILFGWSVTRLQSSHLNDAGIDSVDLHLILALIICMLLRIRSCLFQLPEKFDIIKKQFGICKDDNQPRFLFDCMKRYWTPAIKDYFRFISDIEFNINFRFCSQEWLDLVFIFCIFIWNIITQKDEKYGYLNLYVCCLPVISNKFELFLVKSSSSLWN